MYGGAVTQNPPAGPRSVGMGLGRSWKNVFSSVQCPLFVPLVDVFFIFGGFKFGLGSPGKCPGIEILDFDVLILAGAEFRRFWDDLADFDII